MATRSGVSGRQGPILMNLYTLLLAGSIAATSYDVESTFRVFDRCPGCYEANPFMRPFVDSRGKIYAVQAGLNTSTAWASWELKKAGKKWWWAPMAANIGMHVVAGEHNRRMR